MAGCDDWLAGCAYWVDWLAGFMPVWQLAARLCMFGS